MPSTTDSPPDTASRPRVGLFVTCLVDLHRPNVGFAAIRLLERAGHEVIVPPSQTCCGQPAFNSGDIPSSEAIARNVIEAFEGLERVVVPSGSCAGMIVAHYPKLFADSPSWRARAESLASRTVELVSFLAECGESQAANAPGASEPASSPKAVAYAGVATYHDSCSGLRELGIRDQPRRLLDEVDGLELREMADTEACCGFGGTFCVKYPDISERMVGDKIALAEQTGADTLLGGDLGCLLNIAGRLHRLGQPMKVYHVAEVLADMSDLPPIGAPMTPDGADR